MPDLARISISLEAELLQRFDTYVQQNGYPTRSEAVKGLIREALVSDDWSQAQGDVAGVLTVVYDHHRAGLMQQFIETQHNFESLIQAVQHIHLNHDNCLETLVLRGSVATIQAFMRDVKSLKGLKHAELTLSTLGD